VAVVGCVTLGAGSGAARSERDAAADVWAAYSQRWAATDTYTADFHQRIEVDGIGGDVASGGKFYFSKPDLMRWDYLDGQAQNVVGDGKWVWVYQPDLEQAYRVDYKSAFGSGGLVALLAGREGLSTRYHFSLLEHDSKAVLILLEPIADVGESLELTLEAKTMDLKSVAVRDPAGSVTYVEFDDVHRNVALDHGLFSFAPPPGTDIITTPRRGN
jgi:outer membrane lipoprotein carrier protein